MTSTSAVTQLGNIVQSGRTANAFIEHRVPGASEPHGLSRVPAVGSGSLNLRELVVMQSALQSAQAVTHDSIYVVQNKSHSITLSAALIQNCLVEKAGATVVVAAERNMANTNTLPVMYKDAGLFRVIEPALFGAVVDGADADISDPPWSDVSIEWPDAPSIAFRTVFSRASQKWVGGDLMESNLLQAIVSGLSEAADRTLLAAISAASLPAFSLAAAAARGLRFGNLRALVGTNADGAVVGADGVLRAEGVSAELTRAIPQTIIGDFHKSAIAIYPEVQVHFERMNVNGEMGAVVFANMLPLVPDASAFWLAGG